MERESGGERKRERERESERSILTPCDDLRETFADSSSRASHVGSAREPLGTRLRMAHTWERGEVTEVSPVVRRQGPV